MLGPGPQTGLGWEGATPLYNAVEVWAVAMEYGVASFGLKLSICFNVSFEEIHLAI